MNDKAMFNFYLAFERTPEIHDMLPDNPSIAEVEHVLKSYAFQQTMFCLPSAHHLMVAFLDTVDWTRLAERLLACKLAQKQKTTGMEYASTAVTFQSA